MLRNTVYCIFARELPNKIWDQVVLKQNLILREYGSGHFMDHQYTNFVEGDGWNPIEDTSEALSLS